MKRKSDVDCEIRDTVRPTKRQRQGSKVHLFHLSDELLLRILSFLQIESLTICERTCRRLEGLAKDGEIWREKYYDHFVRQRARRLPGIRSSNKSNDINGVLRYSSPRAPWLEYSHLLNADTIWKHTFKIKYNWTKGRAKATEVQLGCNSVPTVLAKVHRGYLYTADHENGLRIWKHAAVKQSKSLSYSSQPSAIDVEVDGDSLRVAIGYADGLLEVYEVHGQSITLVANRRLASSSVSSIALAWPYAMTMSRSNSTALFQCSQSADDTWSVKCLANLHCDADLSPASLCLRRTKSTLVAGIAFAFNRFNTGWCLGVQELRMDLDGTLTGNRTTSTVETPLRDTFATSSEQPQLTSRSATTSPLSLHPQLMRAPNSLSYSGCYILAGLSDNTLMVYTVTSTDTKLEINLGRRLWGHTSAVSAAEVTSTGKALSISAKSEEMRYWELEELLTSHSMRKTSTAIQPLKLLSEAINLRGDGIGLALKDIKHEATLIRRGVSFDDEQAIVVGERNQTQVISCFDFA